jgi:hypothetical protein
MQQQLEEEFRRELVEELKLSGIDHTSDGSQVVARLLLQSSKTITLVGKHL